jgi:HEAT repeat protein
MVPMSDDQRQPPKEGDELWFGLVGPVRVSDEMTPEREEWAAADRIAQAAHSLQDLAELVASHSNPRVRYEAMPRLRARFPEDALTLEVLVAAAEDPNPMIREGAVMALSDLRTPEAADAVAKRLDDEDFKVRLWAAQTMAFLGDPRAPSDPEAWALRGMVDGPSA